MSVVASENLHLEKMDVKTTFFTWRSGQRDLYAATGKICGSKQGTHGVQAHQEIVWTKASTKYKNFDSFMTKSGFCKAELLLQEIH